MKSLRILAPQDGVPTLKLRYPDAFASHNRLATALLVTAGIVLVCVGFWRFGVSSDQLFGGLSRLWMVIGLMIPPNPGSQLPVYLWAMCETLSIALLGTMLGGLLAIPLALAAARNIAINRVMHFFARRSLDTIRGIDVLIWALVFINVVGLGPFAGILAIAMSDCGAFGKLFSEAIENSDDKPVEGVMAAGGNRWECIRFGVLPQVIPIIASQLLYYFESNTRSATIIGIVGAGGIGLYLANEIQQAEWQRVAFLIMMILIAVSVIDLISSRLRFAIIGRAPSRGH